MRVGGRCVVVGVDGLWWAIVNARGWVWMVDWMVDGMGWWIER